MMYDHCSIQLLNVLNLCSAERKNLLNKLNIPCLDFRNLGLPQIRTVKTIDCRTVSELWFSLK